MSWIVLEIRGPSQYKDPGMGISNVFPRYEDFHVNDNGDRYIGKTTYLYWAGSQMTTRTIIWANDDAHICLPSCWDDMVYIHTRQKNISRLPDYWNQISSNVAVL